MKYQKPEIEKINIEMEYGVMGVPSSEPTPPGLPSYQP